MEGINGVIQLYSFDTDVSLDEETKTYIDLFTCKVDAEWSRAGTYIIHH